MVENKNVNMELKDVKQKIKGKSEINSHYGVEENINLQKLYHTT